MAGLGRFTVPTRVIAGSGAIEKCLATEVAELPGDAIAVVADQGLADSGALDAILDCAGDASRLAICGLMGEGPALAEVEAAAAEARDRGAQAVLTIGGGSALGGGRAVALSLANGDPLTAYVGGQRVPNPAAPNVAVPTTAGSGSEVSSALILYDPSQERHLLIQARGVAPDVAILDGEVLRTLPSGAMVHSALDALTHCLESLGAKAATSFTDALAYEAADIVCASLPAALDRDGEAMQSMIEASAMANMACGSAGLGLVHGLTSAPAIGLPHGYLNAVLLPHALRFNSPNLRPRVLTLAERVDDLYATVGFEPRFLLGEVDARQSRAMARAAISNRAFRENNPRWAEEEDLARLLVDAGAAPPA